MQGGASTTPESDEGASWWVSSVWGLSCAFSECARPSFNLTPKSSWNSRFLLFLFHLSGFGKTK